MYTASMTYVDKLLQTLVLHKSHELEQAQPKVVNTLRSLATSANSQYFITENQSKLVLNLLQNTKQHFPSMIEEIESVLANPMWSKPFRVIAQVKKLYINDSFDDQLITIEFTFSANIRKVITQETRNIEGLIQDTNGKVYHAELTEQNIVLLVELLRPLGFDIDEKLLQYYDTIKSWNIQDVKDQFVLDNMNSSRFLKTVSEDQGMDKTNPLIEYDRSNRYRYFPKCELPDGDSLTKEIATRGRNKVWVNSANHTLADVLKSIHELNRFPLMIVFDQYDQTEAADDLAKIADALDELDKSKVGIYFRLPNTNKGAEFNALIAKNKYNQYLDDFTEVVGVQSGKIPKFFLTNNWQPKSVLALNTQLRSSKTSVYANCCDLIISYSATPPLVEKTDKWL